jgi:hypothetical protein
LRSPKEGDCRCAADSDRTAVDFAARSADQHYFASAAGSARDLRFDSDSVADFEVDSGAVADSHSDSAQADDFRQHSISAAGIADVAAATAAGAAAGDLDSVFAQTQLRQPARNKAP